MAARAGLLNVIGEEKANPPAAPAPGSSSGRLGEDGREGYDYKFIEHLSALLTWLTSLGPRTKSSSKF